MLIIKVLLIHNFYQNSGGEDRVFNNELKLLQNNGIDVVVKTLNNKEINHYNILRKVKLLNSTKWSNRGYAETLEVLLNEKPDICHIHNFFPLLSPSAYSACNQLGIPVLQTLHNYRLICADATLYREGNICEECLNASPYNSLKYGCYHNSRIQTFAVANMILSNQKNGIWQNLVSEYICLTEFMKNKFISAGFPKDKLAVKPNFLFDDPGLDRTNGDSFLYIGRLDVTKGILLLINTFSKLPQMELKVAGHGPLYDKIKTNLPPNINLLGYLDKDSITETIKGSIAVIFPSLWYEGMPMTIVEAFACGKAVIASRLGAMSEMINEGITGLLFEPGNVEDLTKKIVWAHGHRDEMKEMGLNARKEYEKRYTAEVNYKLLMDIYNRNLVE